MAVITISRQIGSGGEQIARLVCEMLRYRYFDKQLLIEAAAEAGLSREQVVDYSEDRYEVQNFLARLVRPGPRPVQRVEVRQQDTAGRVRLTAETVDEAQYVELIKAAIRASAEQDDIVIVGRGGQAILQDVPNVLHVRVIAPEGMRIVRLQKIEGLSVEAAQQKIARQDRATAEYLGRFFGIRWDDPALYHLVINTGKVGIEGVAQIIVDTVVPLRSFPAP
ncbi:MAG: cytidylate kinase family protein [Anaerolineae bacterium]|nr:cytidylate kinase family protein [Anaerolineae bacterium]